MPPTQSPVPIKKFPEEDAHESDDDDYDIDAEFDAQLQAAEPIENDDELRAMERLLNGIKSPVKLVDMMRPSTIYEEPSMNSNESSSRTNSYVTAPDHTTSHTNNDPNMSMDSLMIDGWSVHSSEHINRSIDPDWITDSCSSVQSSAVKVDDLPSITYQRAHSVAAAREQFNETLEEMEYVKDNSKYLLKPVNKVDTVGRQLRTPSPRTDSFAKPGIIVNTPDSDSDRNVIVVDSSPDNSFETAQGSQYQRYLAESDRRTPAVKLERLSRSITISDDEEDAAGEYAVVQR